MKDIGHAESLEMLRIEMEKEQTGAWELNGIQCDTCQECRVTFGISRHEDGWDYYYTNNTSGYTEDGVYDMPEATPYDAMRDLFDSVDFFLTHVSKKRDYQTVVDEYELKTK